MGHKDDESQRKSRSHLLQNKKAKKCKPNCCAWEKNLWTWGLERGEAKMHALQCRGLWNMKCIQQLCHAHPRFLFPTSHLQAFHSLTDSSCAWPLNCPAERMPIDERAHNISLQDPCWSSISNCCPVKISKLSPRDDNREGELKLWNKSQDTSKCNAWHYTLEEALMRWQRAGLYQEGMNPSILCP